MRSWLSAVAVGICCIFLTSATCNAATIYACKKKVGGALRIVSKAKQCLTTETKISWPDAARVAALEAELASLKDLLQHFSRNGDDISITGANLWVKSGTGATSAAVNGLGNLIVGYNELRMSGNDRTGSHNIIVGKNHNYSSFGGLVVGSQNTISGMYSSVSGGYENIASSTGSAVSGGTGNTANGIASSVSGGENNSASGAASSVSGGFSRSTFGTHDWRAGLSAEDQ